MLKYYYFLNDFGLFWRVLRCVRDEKANRLQGDDVEYVLLDLGGKIQSP